MTRLAPVRTFVAVVEFFDLRGTPIQGAYVYSSIGDTIVDVFR